MNARTEGRHHHTGVLQCRGSNPGFGACTPSTLHPQAGVTFGLGLVVQLDALGQGPLGVLWDEALLSSVGLPAKGFCSLTLEHNGLPVACLLLFSEELVAGGGAGHEQPKFLQEMPQWVAHCRGRG